MSYNKDSWVEEYKSVLLVFQEGVGNDTDGIIVEIKNIKTVEYLIEEDGYTLTKISKGLYMMKD